jgi:hypothetical protein
MRSDEAIRSMRFTRVSRDAAMLLSIGLFLSTVGLPGHAVDVDSGRESTQSICDRVFGDRFQEAGPSGATPGTDGYTKLWTDTTESGAGMRRLAVNPDRSCFLVSSTGLGGDVPERLVLMGSDGIPLWSRDTSSVFSAARGPAFVEDGSGDVVVAGILAGSGNGSARAMQFDGATGADGIESPTEPPSRGPDEAEPVPGTDRVWFHEGGGSFGNELFLWDISDNAFVANPTSIGNPAVGSLVALADGGCIIVDNQSDEIVRFDDSGSEVWRQPMQTADGSSTFRIESEDSGAQTVHLAREEGALFIAATTLSGSALDGTYVLRMDVASGDNGAVVSGNINDLSDLSSGTVRTIRRDRSGGWWIVETTSDQTTSDRWDILRFTSDWTFVHSVRAAFPANAMFSDHDLNSVVHDLAILDSDRLILMSGVDNRLSGYTID